MRGPLPPIRGRGSLRKKVLNSLGRAYRWTNQRGCLSPDLGGRLRARRIALGLSTRDVEELTRAKGGLGVSRSTIAYLEAGRRRPSMRVARVLSEVLELPWGLRRSLMHETKRDRIKEWRSTARKLEHRIFSGMRLFIRREALKLEGMK